MEDNEDTGDDNQKLKQGRLILWIALISALLFLPSLLGKGTFLKVLFLICWFLSTVGAMSGISMVSSAIGSNRIIALISMALSLMPLLNLLPISYFLWLTYQHQDDPQESEIIPTAAQLARERAQRRSSSTAAVSSQATTKPGSTALHGQSQRPVATPAKKTSNSIDIKKAIAIVKMAGLSGALEGQVLKAEIQGPADMNENDGPVIRVTQCFGVMYVIDEGNHYRYVSISDLKQSGLNVNQLHQIGHSNLVKFVNSDQPGLQLFGGESSSYHGLAVGGQFESSLVLINELWEGVLKKHIPNGIVLAIPNRDICMFCDARSAQGIAELQSKVTQSFQSGDHPLSAQLLTRSNGNWIAFQPEKPKDLAPLEFKL